MPANEPTVQLSIVVGLHLSTVGYGELIGRVKIVIHYDNKIIIRHFQIYLH